MPDENLIGLYREAALSTADDLHIRVTPKTLPELLDDSAEYIIAVIAVLRSGVVGDGWDVEVDNLASVVATMTLTADAVRVEMRRATT